MDSSKTQIPFTTQIQTHQTLIISIILFFVGAVSRFIFVGEIMYHWDSINFAYGIQEFNVAKGQPHVPGYILYVYLTQFIDLFFHDAQTTLTTISVISSGLAIVLLYLLGKEMFNQTIGIVAALFLATSPLFWFYGVIALPHSLDTLAVILTAWFLYKIIQGQTKLIIPAAIWLGIAGGFRPQTQVFLAPLVLFAGWHLGIKQAIIALVILFFVDLAWFVPLLWLNGGPTEYFEIMGKFSDRFQTTTNVLKGAGWFGFTRNASKLTLYTLYAWGVPLVLFLVGGVFWLFKRPYWRTVVTDKRTWFVILWIGPSFVYYLLIHMGQQGLVFVYLPMLLLLSAAAIYAIPWPQSRLQQGAIITVILANCIIFLIIPAFPLGSTGPKLLNLDTLAIHDAYYQSRFETIRQNFTSDNTVLLATNWRFPQYYLPEYRYEAYGVVAKRELGEGQSTVRDEYRYTGSQLGLTPDADGYFYLVIFDDILAEFNQSIDQTETMTLPNGQSLAYLRFDTQEAIFISPQYYGIVTTNEE